MKKLELCDTFTMARIIVKADLRELAKEAVRKLKNENDQIEEEKKEDVYVDILFSALMGATNEGVEEEIYKLLANVCEITTDQAKHMTISEMKEIIKEIVKENDIENFIKSAMDATK